MSEFCKGVVNETYEQYLFNTRSQAANEGIDVYYAALLRITENCKFGDLEQSLVKDRIVVGVRDPALRKRLMYQKLTLQKCLGMACSFEATNRLQSMSSAALSDGDVNFVQKEKGHRRQKPKPKHSPSSGADAVPWKADSSSGATSGCHDCDSRCYYCGRQNHP